MNGASAARPLSIAVLPGVFDGRALRCTLEEPRPTDTQTDQRERGENDRCTNRAA